MVFTQSGHRGGSLGSVFSLVLVGIAAIAGSAPGQESSKPDQAAARRGELALTQALFLAGRLEP